MCGRFTYLYTWRQLHDLYDSTRVVTERLKAERDVQRDFDRAELQPNYNCAPTQHAPIVRLDGGDRVVDMARWGLIPSWADDIKVGSRMFNARSETAATSPAFRSAFKARRCVVPISSFYEWQAIGGATPKQPWSIFRADGGIMSLAGLWESWRHDGADVRSFTILTTSANSFMRRLHDRMPCVLEPERVAAWLDPKATGETTQSLLVPAADRVLDAHRVGTRVGSVRNNDAELLTPVTVAG